MGIREKINQNRGAATAAAAVIIVIALIFLGTRLFRPKLSHLSQAYFTDDDGQSFFEDSKKNIPPFDHSGKEAVYAFIFADSHGKKFVGYMAKYPPNIKEQMDEAIAKGEEANVIPGTQLIKKPGVDGWFSVSTAKGLEIENDITCPDGSTTGWTVVLPD